MIRRNDLLGVNAEPSTNLGLWLDRYSPDLDQETIRQHHEVTLVRIKPPEGYKAAFQRREQHLRKLDAGFQNGVTRIYTLKFDGRAVVGIGAASVRETQISLLRPWGMPVVPGSGLKGLASNYASVNGEADWERGDFKEKPPGKAQKLVFGAGGDKGTGGAAGSVIFHDAWWIPGEEFPVVTDTMTVHHQEYYKGAGEPLDWDEPNPVSFLSTRGSYQCALSGPPDALDVAAKILTQALKEWGVGAKTAAGYGRATLISETPAAARLATPRTRSALDDFLPFLESELEEGTTQRDRLNAIESDWFAKLLPLSAADRETAAAKISGKIKSPKLRDLVLKLVNRLTSTK